MQTVISLICLLRLCKLCLATCNSRYLTGPLSQSLSYTLFHILPLSHTLSYSPSISHSLIFSILHILYIILSLSISLSPSPLNLGQTSCPDYTSTTSDLAIGCPARVYLSTMFFSCSLSFHFHDESKMILPIFTTTPPPHWRLHFTITFPTRQYITLYHHYIYISFASSSSAAAPPHLNTPT